MAWFKEQAKSASINRDTGEMSVLSRLDSVQMEELRAGFHNLVVELRKVNLQLSITTGEIIETKDVGRDI